jgi:hypothetical protein
MSDVKLWEFNMVLLVNNEYGDKERELPFSFRLRGTDAEAGAALEKITDDLGLEYHGVTCNGGRSEVTDNGTPTPDA